MNENKYKYPGSSLWQLQHLLPLLSVMLLLTTVGCCRKEKLFSGRILTFSFDSTSQIDPEAIREIEVFVYDDEDMLIGRASTGINGTITLDYPDIPTLHCIAWGNSKDSSLELSPLQPGDPIEKAYLALKPLSSHRTETQYHNTSPDLFRGAIQIDNNMTDDRLPTQIVMQQTTASIQIIIDGLPSVTGTEAGDYCVVVNGVGGRIDFLGGYSGKAVHCLTGSFNIEKEYIIPPFRLFPSTEGEEINIDIFHDEKLLKSITQTNDGKPILPAIGKELTLLIKFPSGGVEVKPPGWNSTDVEVSYPK